MLDPRIPDPLIAQLPMKVAVRYPAAFDGFVHEERVIGKDVWKIDLGESNKLLFDKLLNSMFSDVITVPAEADLADYEIDALIEPSIDAFEFSVPQQSQTDAFAVWIRYRLRIYDHLGTQVANWPIAAYGKSQATKFGSDQALRYAAVLAMRDAAALIILQMDKATGISKLSEARARSNIPATVPLPEDDNLQFLAAEDPRDDSD